jgi:hypothetical protein
MSNKMEHLLGQIENHPGELAPAEQAARVAGVIRTMSVDPHLWRVRTKYWEMLKTVLPKYRDKAAKGDEPASEWVKCFLKLGEELNFARHHLQAEG